MSALALRRSALGALVLAVPLALLAIYGLDAAPADQRFVTNFFITLVLALSIQVFCGNSGILSFGHLSFMGVGAYVAALVTIPVAVKATQVPDLPGFLADAHVGFAVSLLLAAFVTAAAAAVVGLPLTRMAPDAMAMATIGVLVIFSVLFEASDTITRGTNGLYAIPVNTTTLVAAGCALLLIFVARAFRESNPGIKLRASRQDALAAAALGANVVRLRLGAWILSGALMGFGGALWAQYNLAFGPRQFFFLQTFNLLAMLVLGGLSTVSGAVVGAAIVTFLSEWLRGVQDGVDLGVVRFGEVPGLVPIVISLLLLLVLRWRRDGLLGHVELDERLGALVRRLPIQRRGGA